MNKFLLLIALFAISFINAQSNFNRGYEVGYGEGYCYDKGIGCIKPISPIAPIPKIGESLDSYQDGYNRGFNDGLSKQKSESPNGGNRERFKTSDPDFVDDFIYQPNYDLMLKVLELKQKQFNATYDTRQRIFYENVKNAYESNFQKDYGNVIHYCQSALNTGFYNSEVYSLMGIAYYHIGNYENSLAYLNKAKISGEKSDEINSYVRNVQTQLSIAKKQKLEDYKNFKKRKSLTFGVKAGITNNENLTSPLFGIFLQGSKNRNFAGVAEVQYFQKLLDYYYNFEDSKKEGIVQINLLLKHRLIKRLEVLYGGGFNTNVTNQSDMFATASGGLQFYFTHQLFVDGRYQYAFTNEFPENSFLISLGFNF